MIKQGLLHGIRCSSPLLYGVLLFWRAEPSPSSLRDATSPEGGRFIVLTGSCKKSSPFRGELARRQA